MAATNCRSVVRNSRAPGDAYAAFEMLPPLVRAALQFGVQDWCPIAVSEAYWPISRLCRSAGVPASDAPALYVERFHQAEEGEILLHSKRYGREHKTPAPHVAAGASVLREMPLRARRRGVRQQPTPGD